METHRSRLRQGHLAPVRVYGTWSFLDSPVTKQFCHRRVRQRLVSRHWWGA
ncbi:hypothetical protein DL89DRAFT_265784 [Linderina pennispora]|uniref:Uncharacterized protein n=1 Tax=Linderina pennispora TaxID=61395 RepID=A0A1Y1WF70_9FUNG|nr:uncharacterized protein DL89DRAFT_265784 [Linderina pennispora]ORX72153.1 hypothetical protein DL89DRAFT_265784 [Linderina pennispora]